MGPFESNFQQANNLMDLPGDSMMPLTENSNDMLTEEIKK